MQALFVKQIQDNSYYLTSMETSGEDMMKALKEADRDVSKLEKIFGMGEGDLGKIR